MNITKDQSPKFHAYILKIHVESEQDQEFLAELVERGLNEFKGLGGFSSKFQTQALTLFNQLKETLS